VDIRASLPPFAIRFDTVNELTEKFKETELVGRGFTADVYAWGVGKVLKLFHGWVDN